MITVEDLAGVLARAAGEEWPPVGDYAPDRTYHWLGEAEAALPIVTADRTELARKLDQCATNASIWSARYAPDTPQRIAQVAAMKAYAWAAVLVRGENA